MGAPAPRHPQRRGGLAAARAPFDRGAARNILAFGVLHVCVSPTVAALPVAPGAASLVSLPIAAPATALPVCQPCGPSAAAGAAAGAERPSPALARPRSLHL